MKKIYTIIFVLSVGIALSQSIPNGAFENWSTLSLNTLDYYWNSNYESLQKGLPQNTIKVADPQAGSYAIQLTTVCNATDTMFAYFTNGDPGSWTGGMPIGGTPTSLTGYYKSNIVTGDTALLLLIFKHTSSTIGAFLYKFTGVHSSYTPFTLSISGLPSTPDTVILAATSSNALANMQKCGSMLQLDNLSFTGIASQPSQMNGSFENWNVQNLLTPTNWYTQGVDLSPGNPSPSILQTTDKYQGNYAIELKTYYNAHDHKARTSQISTGYWDCNSGPCTLKGGYPFANAIDTLEFWYKYTPHGGDSAWVWMFFKKNGSNIGGNSKYLLTSSSYQHVQIPFNTGTTPDSVVIQIQSSQWYDTLVTSVGSDLKIDEIHFKSQPLFTSVPKFQFENNVFVYPNPSSGNFSIQSLAINIESIEVYNALGEKILVQTINNKITDFNIDIDGIYFIKINVAGKIITKKLIVTH